MYAEITAAIQSVKTIAELARAANSLVNQQEIISATTDANSRLMEAITVALASQEKQSELLAKAASLERELTELRAKQSKSERYQLYKFATGTLVYRLKVEFSTDEPEHFLCAKCADEGKHAKLQPFGSRRLKCIACNSVFQTEADPPMEPRQYLSGVRMR